MLYLSIVVSLVAIFLFTRLFIIKQELKKIAIQISNYNNNHSHKKIDVALVDEAIEYLGAEINQLIDLHVKEQREKIRFENELKQSIANMSHDLRTPLTSILGYIQMSQSDDITEEEKQEFLSTAQKRAWRLQTLLNEFFELSVIESNDYQLKSESVNLKNLTIDVLMSFYDRFNQRNMEPAVTIPEDSIFIIGDESAVTRMIENLISNAITHSTGNIVVSIEQEDKRTRLIVKNDAPDLTQEDVHHFFDRFYMADQTRSNKGAGLGLSIAKAFMEKMNGTITATITKGQLAIICEWTKHTVNS
ncbi:sensor histidine kinase [Ornithinibacillus contaminans]|uniref:sensor histidine kinase n=1 Tax=Ornithinibacillus contaminans TaxID=694055 RepID=UPI00064D779C|nr:HAMP domain-containing sensor histidine kinase [Ornithinibacillus contaminans]